jgi:flagellar hook assembly protein FlgD
MRRSFVVFALAAGILAAATQTTMAKVYPSYIRITQDFSTAPFDGSFADGTGAAIRFILNQPADSVIVTIVPVAGGSPVATLKKTGLAAGDNAVLWNGATTPKVAAPTGAYKAVVTAYSAGSATYAELVPVTTPSIFTRGVTTVTNPALRWFGFTYAVSGGGYATGVVRHAANMQQWGNKPDSALLTTTGVPIPGTPGARYAPTADQDGYIYVIGFTDRRIYRFHTDTLAVLPFDSSAYGMRIQGLDVRGTGASKTMYVIGDSAVFSVPIGTQSFNTATPQKIVTVGSNLGKGLVFWDSRVGQDSSLYVIWRADSAIGTLPAASRGIMKFNLKTGSLPKTLADTVWTARLADGDPVTLALWDGATTDASDDVLYLSTDLGGAGTVLSGIWAITNLTAAQPTRTIAWADPDNNSSSSRSAIACDPVGNIVYFENSNEQVALIGPPSLANSYSLTSLDTLNVATAGYVFSLVTIGEARIDANADFQPDRKGDTLRVIGIINSVNIQTTNFGYFIQDNNGGLEIFKSGLTGAPTVKPGYRVMVTGMIDYYRGTTEIVPRSLATDITVLDTGNAITAVPLTIAQLKANGELYESRRVQLTLAYPLDFSSATWPATGVAANLNVWNGIDTLLLRVDSDTEVPGAPYPTFPAKITGVVSQFTTASSVYNDGYQITPMFKADFVAVNAPPVAKFALLEPTKGSRLVLNDTAQVVTFRWKSALDFNGDVLTYQWMPVGKTAVVTGNSAHDTLLVRTGKQMLTYLGTVDSVVLKWTVAVKDPTNPVVYNTDTASVTVVRGTITGVSETEMVPTAFSLSQNYPNPFNPSTTIRFGLPSASNVTLRLYDALGREVATLIDEQRPAGYVHAVWNGTNNNGARVASGVYFYRIEATPVDGSPMYVQLKKMVLIK